VSNRVALATVLAVVTAFFYAMSNVLELLEAEKVPDEYSMKPGLLVRLVRRPRWLLGLLSDFGGYLCHAAALKEIEAQGWSLNPGRYVGVAPGEQVSDEDFKEQLETLNEELETLNAQARDLEQTIARNVAEILEA